MSDLAVEYLAARLVELPLVRSFVSAQTRLTSRRVILIEVRSGGRTGWGEAAPVPGHTGDDVDDLWTQMSGTIDGFGLGLLDRADGLLGAAVAEALADLMARHRGEPLAESGDEAVAPASAAIGIDDTGNPDLELVASAAGAGYRFAKLKVTAHTQPARIEAVLASYPQIRFGVDANGSLGVDDQALLTALDGLGLDYIEQPGPPAHLEWHARLRDRLVTPLSLDESAASVKRVWDIIGARAADIVNLKVGRFGPQTTVELARAAVAAGVKARLGGLVETGIGRAHSVALASHQIFSVTGDIAGSDRYFADDLVRPQWRLRDGVLPVPDGPGIGVTVDRDAVTAHTVASIEAGDTDTGI